MDIYTVQLFQIRQQKKIQKKTSTSYLTAYLMTSYTQIASAFSKLGLNENSLVTNQDMLRALDTLAQNYGMNQYDRNVADQLWSQTEKQNDNRVYIRDFIGTVLRGEGLINQRINELQRQIQSINDPVEKTQALQDLASYSDDLKFLKIPFGVGPPRNSKVLEDSMRSGQGNFINNQSRISNSTVIFAKQIPERSSGSSTDLKIAFGIACILTFIEIILMFHKHHFYSLLAYLSFFAIFFLGYFDLHYMRFVKINLLISVLLDFVWLIVNFGEYWSPRAQTQHSSLQWGFLKFILFFMLGLMFFKVVIAAILFKYRNNPHNMRRTVSLCGYRYTLNASPVSPIAKIMSGAQSNQSYSPGGFMNNPSGVSHYQNSY